MSLSILGALTWRLLNRRVLPIGAGTREFRLMGSVVVRRGVFLRNCKGGKALRTWAHDLGPTDIHSTPRRPSQPTTQPT